MISYYKENCETGLVVRIYLAGIDNSAWLFMKEAEEFLAKWDQYSDKI